MGERRRIWRCRNTFYLRVSGTGTLKTIVHLLPGDVAWFNQEGEAAAELELLSLVTGKVVKQLEHEANQRKRKKKGEKEQALVMGKLLQLTYRYQHMSPSFTLLTFKDRPEEGAGTTGGCMNYLPSSKSTLLVWVHRCMEQEGKDGSPPNTSLPSESSYKAGELDKYFTGHKQLTGPEAPAVIDAGASEEEQIQMAIALSLSKQEAEMIVAAGSDGVEETKGIG
ncbi:unnamed protein product [Chrysoparadoxa australica]